MTLEEAIERHSEKRVRYLEYQAAAFVLMCACCVAYFYTRIVALFVIGLVFLGVNILMLVIGRRESNAVMCLCEIERRQLLKDVEDVGR